ncbi:MAG TPA: hypothetical protein VL486_11090 [Verrucomicrobiae bacterium]|nr:hypothetical protein [Verrucomicrobiae bacterium]
MNKLNKRSWCFLWLTSAALFGLPVVQATVADGPFSTSDLKRFVADSVPFLEWAKTGAPNQLIEHLAENPNSVAQFPEAVRFLRDRGWEPERFAYVLSHVLVAYKMLGMGGNSSRLLEKLAETKVAVEGDPSQTEAQKARTLAVVEECQRDVRETEKAFATLPPEEVRLLWLYRAELRQALDGRLPISERVLPNPTVKKKR